jgi:hypothetical protein
VFKAYFNNDAKYEAEHKKLTRALGVLTYEKFEKPQEFLAESPLEVIADLKQFAMVRDPNEFNCYIYGHQSRKDIPIQPNLL